MPCGRSGLASGRLITMFSSVARSSRKSLTFAPPISTPSGAPLPSQSSERFPLFRSVSGIRPRLLAAQRRLPDQTVAGQPLPLDPLQLVVGEQPLPPELLEHPRLRPLLKTPVRRARGADPGRAQRVPLHPRAQHEQNRVHRVPVWHARVVTPERMRRTRRQQRLHPPPCRVGEPPAGGPIYET